MAAITGFSGGVLPALSGAMSVISTLDRVMRVMGDVSGASARSDAKDLARRQALAYQQLVDRNRLEQTQAEEDAAQQKAALEAGSAAEEEKRLAALKRAVARQRAVFGGQGLSPDEGSAEAVLLGLFQESENDKTQRERTDAVRQKVIDLGLANVRRRNLLEETQLVARQQLEQA